MGAAALKVVPELLRLGGLADLQSVVAIATISGIGEPTRQLDHAHVEFFKRIENPIGVKIGAATTTDELLRLIDALNHI